MKWCSGKLAFIGCTSRPSQMKNIDSNSQARKGSSMWAATLAGPM